MTPNLGMAVCRKFGLFLTFASVSFDFGGVSWGGPKRELMEFSMIRSGDGLASPPFVPFFSFEASLDCIKNKMQSNANRAKRVMASMDRKGGLGHMCL